LEIDADLGFQKRLWKIERIGQAFILFIVLVALSGGLGGLGPANSAIVKAPGNSGWVEYDRFLRFETLTILRICFKINAAHQEKIRVTLNQDYLRRFRCQQVIPAPESVQIEEPSVVFTFPIADVTFPTVITFYLEPEHSGWAEAKLEWGDKGAAGLVFWQLIYP
jgi:hypothetical protein